MSALPGRINLTAWTSMDYFGVGVDVRKSDMQKAIRLGDEAQALCSFFSVYYISQLVPTDDKRIKIAKGISTNIINRLIVCALEDVGPADPALVARVVSELMLMSKEVSLRDPSKLHRIVVFLCRAPKSRVCSHLYHVYHPRNRELRASLGFEVDPPKGFASPSCFAHFGSIEFLWSDSPIEIDRATREFMKCAVEVVGHEIPHMKTFYEELEKFSKNKELAPFARYIVASAHFATSQSSRGEHFRYMAAWPSPTTFADVEGAPPFSLYYGMPPRPEFDGLVWRAPMDVSIDVHTAEGRKRKRNVVDFRVQGAVVNNECKTMTNELEKKVYTDQDSMRLALRTSTAA